MSKGRILVVDDEPTILDICGQTLQQIGYTVKLHSNAADGIRSAQSETFDLALLDLGLPDMDGLDLHRELRSIDENLIAVTITGNPRSKRRSRRSATEPSITCPSPSPPTS